MTVVGQAEGVGGVVAGTVRVVAVAGMEEGESNPPSSAPPSLLSLLVLLPRSTTLKMLSRVAARTLRSSLRFPALPRASPTLLPSFAAPSAARSLLRPFSSSLSRLEPCTPLPSIPSSPLSPADHP